jgi:hypothetical protein
MLAFSIRRHSRVTDFSENGLRVARSGRATAIESSFPIRFREQLSKSGQVRQEIGGTLGGWSGYNRLILPASCLLANIPSWRFTLFRQR